jgi:DNA-binding NtrC family response regulator
MNPAILLVDDDAIVLTLMRRIVPEAAPDYDLVAVLDSTTALALIALRPIALVITNQYIPGMEGAALTATIKAAAPQCPVILMTEAATPEIRQRAEAAGADAVLSKPFGFEQLASTMRAALRTSSATRRRSRQRRRRSSDKPPRSSD